jgi:DNA-binding GntR family transcriptional regulator
VNQSYRGEPLSELLARLPDNDLDQLAASIAACHRAAASRALKNHDTRTAQFHRDCAGDVLRRLREANA